MLKIKKFDIWLTKGDSAYISLTPKDKAGVPLELTENDRVRCQVRKDDDGGELVIEGNIIRDGNKFTWYLRPDDTKSLEVGTYYWDAQVEIAEPHDVFTFTPVSEFNVMKEVTE